MDACQIKRYGVMVVPKTPSSVMSQVASQRNAGTNAENSTWSHGG